MQDEQNVQIDMVKNIIRKELKVEHFPERRGKKIFVFNGYQQIKKEDTEKYKLFSKGWYMYRNHTNSNPGKFAS